MLADVSNLFPTMLHLQEGQYFIRIFQKIILENISLRDVVITTYLDNDDALRYDYVEGVQRLAGQVRNRTFISFKYGIQYFTELNIAIRVVLETIIFFIYRKIRGKCSFANRDGLWQPYQCRAI